jgi:hypothetical protein
LIPIFFQIKFQNKLLSKARNLTNKIKIKIKIKIKMKYRNETEPASLFAKLKRRPFCGPFPIWAFAEAIKYESVLIMSFFLSNSRHQLF